ncbi:hypothetical protein Pen01_08640 [Phytomonospora endophytica]|nr:hypothetical protein Pen01_08640 [Phytomonospora endophytica]
MDVDFDTRPTAPRGIVRGSDTYGTTAVIAVETARRPIAHPAPSPECSRPPKPPTRPPSSASSPRTGSSGPSRSRRRLADELAGMPAHPRAEAAGASDGDAVNRRRCDCVPSRRPTLK